MKITRFILGLSLLSFCAVVTSCSDDDSTTPIETPQDLVAVDYGVLDNSRAYTKTATQIITGNTNVTTNSSIYLKSKNNVDVRIHTESLKDKNGNAVTGEIDVHFTEFFDPVDMLLADLPTVDFSEGHSLDEAKLLVSGGGFGVELYQDGKAIYSDNVIVRIPSSLTGESLEMSLWEGSTENNLMGFSTLPIEKNWVELFVDEAPIYVTVVYTDGFGYFGINRHYGAVDSVMPTLTTPAAYTTNNSQVYFMPKGEVSLSYFPMQLPTDMEGHVVFVAINANNDYIYAIKEVKISSDLEVNFTAAEMKVANLEEFKKQLKLL